MKLLSDISVVVKLVTIAVIAGFVIGIWTTSARFAGCTSDPAPSAVSSAAPQSVERPPAAGQPVACR